VKQQENKKVFTIDDLSEEDRNAYDEQLAQQPQLIKAAEERKKRELPPRKGILYDVVEKGYKSCRVS